MLVHVSPFVPHGRHGTVAGPCMTRYRIRSTRRRGWHRSFLGHRKPFRCASVSRCVRRGAPAVGPVPCTGRPPCSLILSISGKAHDDTVHPVTQGGVVGRHDIDAIRAGQLPAGPDGDARAPDDDRRALAGSGQYGAGVRPSRLGRTPAPRRGYCFGAFSFRMAFAFVTASSTSFFGSALASVAAFVATSLSIRSRTGS
jgi:hypothetical protein